MSKSVNPMKATTGNVSRVLNGGGAMRAAPRKNWIGYESGYLVRMETHIETREVQIVVWHECETNMIQRPERDKAEKAKSESLYQFALSGKFHVTRGRSFYNDNPVLIVTEKTTQK